MAGIGADIAEVLNELGTLATILRSGSNLTEKITYEINEQATNTFIREHVLNASLAYNTVIVSGDLLQFNGETYLAVNKTPDNFEGEVVEFVATLFKCNLPAEALVVSPTKTQDGATFEITQGWAVRVAAPTYGLMNQGMRDAKNNPLAFTGKEPDYLLKCIVPASYGVQRLDRLIVSAAEYYRVQDIEKYQYPGVHVLYLVADERPEYTP